MERQLELLIRIGTTQRKQYSGTKNGYGFDVEKRGHGFAAFEWLPVLDIVYATEAESKEAEEAMRHAIKSPIYVQCSNAGGLA